jgi:hypothetical protein
MQDTAPNALGATAWSSTQRPEWCGSALRLRSATVSRRSGEARRRMCAHLRAAVQGCTRTTGCEAKLAPWHADLPAEPEPLAKAGRGEALAKTEVSPLDEAGCGPPLDHR